jgi:hypothetical protein
LVRFNILLFLKNYYHILQIPENADNAEIRKAFRRLAMRYHPDVSKSPDAHEQFIRITEAYEALIDPAKRQHYNQVFNRYAGHYDAVSGDDAVVLYGFEAFGAARAAKYSKMTLQHLLNHLGLVALSLVYIYYIIVYLCLGIAGVALSISGFITSSEYFWKCLVVLIISLLILRAAYRMYRRILK